MKLEKHGGNIHKFNYKVCDFSANLNPLGMPKACKTAIIENLENYESYPDPYSYELKKAIGRHHHVNSDSVCCGNGAADLIFRIAVGFRPKKGLIIAPTFSEYGEALDTVGCEVDYFMLREEDSFRLNDEMTERLVAEIKEKSYQIVFLCNPNNPTGILTDKINVMKIAEACDLNQCRLVLDECFIDFVYDEESYSILKHIGNFKNIIVLKSFTKMFSMAGIRLGYCICSSEEDKTKIENTMQTWSVSTVATKVGVAAMNLSGFEEKTKEYVLKERKYLMNELTKLGFKVYESETNYIFFKSERALDDLLLNEGILIRNCSNYRGLVQGFYRIAVRTTEENQKLIEVLNRLHQKGETIYKKTDVIWQV